MGGMGAWTVAGHYPDRFAGIVAISARNDWYLWHDRTRQEVPPFKQFLVDLEFGSTVLDNFRHVPVLCYHGSLDPVAKPQQSARAVKELREHGFDAELRWLRGADHWIITDVLLDDSIFQWMAKRRRPPAPRRVTFKTYSLRYTRAYWLRVDQFVRWGTPATVDATIAEDNTIDVTTTNVASLVLYPPAQLLPPTERPQVTCNGNAMDPVASGDGGWRIWIDPLPPSPTKLRKTPKLCGPAKEVFNSPFLFVWGSQGGLRSDNTLKENAERAVLDWARFTDSDPELLIELYDKIVKDEKLTDEQRKNNNLILFGTPQTNSVLDELAPKLPIRIEGDATSTRYIIGDKTYVGNDWDTGFVMVYPNPESPGRYIYIQSGYTYGADLAVNHKLDLLPDFVLYTSNVDRDDTNAFLSAGFFDINWSLDADLTWHDDGKGDPRKTLPMFGPLSPIPEQEDATP